MKPVHALIWLTICCMTLGRTLIALVESMRSYESKDELSLTERAQSESPRRRRLRQPHLRLRLRLRLLRRHDQRW